MSDIPRWAYQYGGMTPFHPSPGGGWVAYADHVAALLTQDRQHMEQQAAAVAAARTMGYVEGQADMRKYLLADDTHSFTYGYREGVRDARDAVEALSYDDLSRDQGPDATKRQALAAIDGLTNGKKEA